MLTKVGYQSMLTMIDKSGSGPQSQSVSMGENGEAENHLTE